MKPTWTTPFFGVQHLESLKQGWQITVAQYSAHSDCWIRPPGAGFGGINTYHDTIEQAQHHGEREARFMNAFIPDRQIDPPDQYWTDDDEIAFAKWQAEWIASLWQEFAETERDRFNEFCRDKFDAEHADDGYDDDLAYEQSREVGAL